MKVSHYGLHPECFADWFNVNETAEFSALQRKETNENNSDNFFAENSSFFVGKYKKYTAELEGESYIFKMREREEAPEMPEVEYLCNQIAVELNLPVAHFYYIRFQHDNIFVTKNFIPKNGFVDLHHIYHYRPNHEHTCAGLLRIVGEYTKSPRDIHTLIYMILFDALIGNHDRHGRNLGFISSHQHLSLSPIYDNVSYLSLESGEMLKAHFNPTGKIKTEISDSPSMSDYIFEFKKLHYTEICKEFREKISTSKITALINNSFCSTLMKRALKKLILARIEELDDALSR